MGSSSANAQPSRSRARTKRSPAIACNRNHSRDASAGDDASRRARVTSAVGLPSACPKSCAASPIDRSSPGSPSSALIRGASHGSGAGRPGQTPSFSPPSPAPQRAHHAVERGLVEEARDPARAARVAETAVQTAALFSESWGDVTAELTLPGGAEPPPTAIALDDPAPPALVAVGRARQTGEHSLAVPVTLRDAGGREFSLSLRIKLDVGLGPAEEE